MPRKLLTLALAALACAPSAAAAPRVLAPGIVYDRQLEFTRSGPVAIHVLTTPRPGGLYDLEPVLATGVVPGRERITNMQRRLAAEATVAGVNGDGFTSDGIPTGLLIQDGIVKTAPHDGRSSIGIDPTGMLHVGQVKMFGTWQGVGQRRPLVYVNRPPGPNGVSLYTPSFGPATPITQGVIEAMLVDFPALRPQTDLTGQVVQLNLTGGATPIPPNGAVLAARGVQARFLSSEANPGQEVHVRLLLQPDWSGVVDALGGGPALVRGGRPVFRAGEEFGTELLSLRAPRTAVGQRRDGSIVMVAADGGRPGYSVGLSNFELARTLVRLGCVTGAALDGGLSTTMAFDGQLLNRPLDRSGERPVSEGLFVLYEGVQVADPAVDVLSPNGDDQNERQLLTYKLVRRSQVAVRLIGPDRAVRYSEDGVKEPGVYQLPWTGRKQDGSLELEGSWRFAVTVLDDEARSSAAERRFALNTTLGFLAVSPPRIASGPPRSRLRVRFRLSRPAVVQTLIESASGAVVRSIPRRRYPAGSMVETWDGRTADGRALDTGRYLVRVVAYNELGRAELEQAFSLRRVAPPRPKPKPKPRDNR